MRIYTRTGDDGTTGLYGGSRVPKDDPRVEAYGTLDELNALLGEARAGGLPESVDRTVSRVQSQLFDLGAHVAASAGRSVTCALPGDDEAQRLEARIDAMEAELASLKTFILPGGCLGAARLHHARTVCRRAERRLTTVMRTEADVVDPVGLVWLNRLSDYLFVAARWTNHKEGVADIPWESDA